MSDIEKRFTVALSFAGEHRAYVEKVAELLTAELGQEKVFYDNFFKDELARIDLDTYLMNIYREQSELVAVFLCENYKTKQWCGLEWRAVRDLIKNKKMADIMPFRFDDTPIEGLLSIDGYIKVNQNSPKETVDYILKRLKKNAESSLQTNLIAPRLPEPLTYREQVANRLNLSLETIKTTSKELSISLISEYLNYPAVSLVEDYFNAKQEPPLEFLQKYSDFFGIEINWLRHGQGEMFRIYKAVVIYPTWYKEKIENSNPEKVYFIRSEGESGKSGVILKFSKYNYLILQNTYSIRGGVGETGTSLIESFYNLIYTLSKSNLEGRIVKEEYFKNLFDGKIFPGTLIESTNNGMYWCDDFLDYDHQRHNAKSYEMWYGVEFINAQQVLKGKIERIAKIK